MMKPKPHILIISSWWPTSQKSNGTFVELHALGLASRACKCAVLLTTESSFGPFIKSGLKDKRLSDFRRHKRLNFIENSVVYKTPLRFSKNPLAKRKKIVTNQTLSRIADYISKNGRPDFIFHHGVFNYTHLSQAISSKFEIPIWYMENSPKISLEEIPSANPYVSESDLIEFARSANRRFAVTQAYVRKMESVFGVSFELCPNIITDDFFIDPDQRESSTNYFQFVNVAILDERKNQQLLIRSFAENYRGNEFYKLVIAGDGSLYNELKRLALELKVEDQVSITGFLNRAELVDLLDESHCFVLSSKSETFGVVVIEAMARGIPAITSNIDGTKEIIAKHNGILFEEGSEADLSQALKEIVKNYDQYKPSKIINGVKQKYGPDASFNALIGSE